MSGTSTGAIVLCGGLSSRMGRPKAWLPWFGRTLVEHVVATLHAVVDEVVVVTSAALDLPALEARVVRDRSPELGPLAGLREGLAAARSDRLFVTATDAPFLTPTFVAALLAREWAAAPSADGHVQVLSAVLPRSAEATAAALLESGRRRPLDLFEALDFEALDAAGLAGVGRADEPAPWQGFNTPAAYLDAVRAIDPAATCEVELLGRAALRATQAQGRVPVGDLASVLAAFGVAPELVDGDRIAASHLVSLGGRSLVRDLAVPVGPDERISVLDAQAGG